MPTFRLGADEGDLLMSPNSSFILTGTPRAHFRVSRLVVQRDDKGAPFVLDLKIGHFSQFELGAHPRPVEHPTTSIAFVGLVRQNEMVILDLQNRSDEPARIQAWLEGEYLA